MWPVTERSATMTRTTRIVPSARRSSSAGRFVIRPNLRADHPAVLGNTRCIKDCRLGTIRECSSRGTGAGSRHTGCYGGHRLGNEIYDRACALRPRNGRIFLITIDSPETPFSVIAASGFSAGSARRLPLACARPVSMLRSPTRGDDDPSVAPQPCADLGAAVEVDHVLV